MIKLKRGVSLLLLIITVVVLLIIVGTVILTISNSKVVDSAKKAKFMESFRNVEQGVDLYTLSNFNVSNYSDYELPVKGMLTLQEKTEIKNTIPTLNLTIESFNQGNPIDEIELAWIDLSKLPVNGKKNIKYIIDIKTRQIYDYYGETFEEKRWHTIDLGVEDVETPNGGDGANIEEIWDGWIKLTLYYPSSSTEKKWRLGSEGEVRYDPMLMWQDYNGSITIPLDRVKDVWIKYKLNGKEITIPPVGTVLVDIVPDKIGTTKVSSVKVKINYDEGAATKEYRVGDSGWLEYGGEFTVTENCIIEARASKTENVYDSDGSILTTRQINGRDLVYIGNIGANETEQIKDSNLPAPIITRFAAQTGDEKARVVVTYPENAARKIYKVNYGIEQTYSSDISITNWGTYIIAYYYDSNGKISKASSILINQGSTPKDPEDHIPNPPNPPIPPSVDALVPAPTVVVNPSVGLVEQVQVSINAPANANKIYIKLSRYGSYEEYIGSITVRNNMEVYAYYITNDGYKSNQGYGVVSNIKQTNKPYLHIDAKVYPYSGTYGQSEVTVTVKHSDANTVEYSDDGIIYSPYISPFKVTENKRIYARAINTYGVTEAYLDITNIGKITPPVPIENIPININVDPEPNLSSTRVAKANVTIEYSDKATEKYYRLGRYGTLQVYTGEFEITSNTTVYAYAKGTNAKGETLKLVDNISSGIAEPNIIANPGNSKQTSKVLVTIEYDKYATIKKYSIDGGSLVDYIGEIEVTKNNTVIYAYSQNEIGQKTDSKYTVENIVTDPPIVVLDKGKYYLLKLNYPDESKIREYKWKENGEWKSYKEAGILLIKPQYKDQLLQNGVLINIEDENGRQINFAGDYYLIDVPISELFENLFMRWDASRPSIPQIIITPTEATRQVTIDIVYGDNLVKKQYRILTPGETLGAWQDYTGSIEIDKNNSVIYAKCMNDSEMWSPEALKKVINIDEMPPVIDLEADLNTILQKVSVKVKVIDDVSVGKIKWASGLKDQDYFKTSGTEIINNSTINITNNGYYTFYSEDMVGNTQIATLEVTNVDLTPPIIDIQVNPENTVGLQTNISINYGDSVTKQYKIGASNNTWINYTGGFSLTSYTVLTNNWKNDDGTVTVYAKGKDSVGNEITVQKKILSLDLDKPSDPIINSNSGYPIITEYGIVYGGDTTITYDKRSDIDNYYSIDSGNTWNIYTGKFNMVSGTILAKSVKKTTGLEVAVSKTITVPNDSIKSQAYDGNDSTYATSSSATRVEIMSIDPSIYEKNLRFKVTGYGRYNAATITFCDSSGAVITEPIKVWDSRSFEGIVTVPQGSVTLRSSFPGDSSIRIYEIQVSNEPTFNISDGYMLLHADPTKAIRSAYQNITINYFSTSVQKLYRVAPSEEWLVYNNQPVKVLKDQTIYAKGIDENGVETRLVTSHTAKVLDAIGMLAYDDDFATYAASTSASRVEKMSIDPSMQGKNVRIKAIGYGRYNSATISFCDSSGSVITQPIRVWDSRSFDGIVPVPQNAVTIRSDFPGDSSIRIYDIQPSL
ncbi:MAG: hypothetical protein N2749_05555 [Clostridia bacterium]|nr:hypothetical protein [Clostridia bacterium]